MARVKLSLSVPESLFREAEELASRMGISRSELYSRAIREFLDELVRPRLVRDQATDPPAPGRARKQ